MEASSAIAAHAPAAAASHGPYPGLRPFHPNESRLFFGRENETAEVAALLERQQLVVIHGASGCGKSSLVRAGLIPLFYRDVRANGRRAEVVILRPSELRGPIRALTEQLDISLPLSPSHTNDDQGYADWGEMLIASPDLQADIEQAVQAHNATLCVIIDQFEEVFQLARTDGNAEAARLIQLLVQLDTPARSGSGLGERALSAIVTMRSDYLGQCSLWDGLAETVNRAQYLLPKISTVGLLRAIHLPARHLGCMVDDGVSEQLLPTVSGELDGLPIVQHALMRAWNAASIRCGGGGKIPDQVIGIDLETIGGPKDALSRHANEVLAETISQRAAAAEAAHWMFRALSEVDADGKIIRRACRLKDLVAVASAPEDTVRIIIETFRRPENSLLTPDTQTPLTPEILIDVGHEALLRRWSWISDTSYDDKGDPRGLAYRELQDGMIWRSLVVQGEELSEHRGGVLSPAATEGRLPWYNDIRRRPEWARRHRVRAGSRLDWQREQDIVAALMQGSELNLIAEQEKFDRETRMVASLRRSRRTILALTAVLASLMVVGGSYVVFLYVEAKNAEQVAKNAEQVTNLSYRQSKAAAEHLAQEMARRKCLGSSPATLQACIYQAVGKTYADFLKTTGARREAVGPASAIDGSLVPPQRP